MKMHAKLGLIFSLIALLSILANTVFYYSYEKRAYEDRAAENLTALGEKMIQQFEDMVQVMDYTLENLIANNEFMGAMSDLAHIDRAQPQNQPRLIAAQSAMSGALYRDPLNKNFYRVNAYNRLGDFYSSRFDNRDTVNALTHDIGAIIEDIAFLRQLDAQPFIRLLIPPYRDPFTAPRDVTVFGAARAVIWMGKSVGYLEVQAGAEQLAQIFSSEGGALAVDARLSDGTPLHQSPSIENGFSVNLNSRKLGLTLTLTQSMEEWRSGALQFAWRTVLIGLATVLMAVIAINLISRRMTRSLRELEHEITHMELQGGVLAKVGGAPVDDARGGDEIHNVQQAFHALVERLGVSIRDEMRARELHTQARLSALQAQINPHFIYNTLNMIGSKSLENGNLELARLTEKFAEMLRYSTDIHRRTATVSEEVRHAGLYLELCKARYEDRFAYELDVPVAMYGYALPRLTLQPLVENTLVHGYENSAGPMVVSVTGAPQGDGFVLTVRDNGDGFQEDVLAALLQAIDELKRGGHALDEDEARPGVGMLNTFARLYAYSGGKMDVQLCNDGGAVVKIVFFADAQKRSES